MTDLEGKPTLRLQSCPRWSEGSQCGQKCMSHIESAPEDCLVRRVVTQWYKGKTCADCAKAFTENDWIAHKPCVLSPEGQTLEWKDVQAERILAVIESFKPICWNCHLSETFRRQYPEIVVDRDRNT